MGILYSLLKFSYNNGYLASLKMIPSEELYGRKFNTPISWDKPIDIVVIVPNLLKEMEDKMRKIKKILKATQDKKKFYTKRNTFFRDFKVGDHVFLKVKVKRSSLRLGCYPKLVV
jgi:hypothetical protein